MKKKLVELHNALIFLAVRVFITFETCDLACSKTEKPDFYRFAEWQKQIRKTLFI